MRTRAFTLVLFGIYVLSTINISAQNPGYMGKHIVISGEGSFSGSAFIMKKTWLKYGANAEFVLNKKISFGFGYLYNSTYSDYKERSDDYFTYSGFNLQTHTFGIDFYVYSSGIAPLGDFIRFRLFYMQNHSNDFYDNKTPINSGIDPYSAPSYSESELSNSNYGVSIFFGRKRIFYNVLSVAYGFKLGLTTSNPVTYSITYDDIFGYGNENSFSKSTSYENFFSTLVSLNVNIGFVL